jgi:hypothetical protein
MAMLQNLLHLFVNGQTACERFHGRFSNSRTALVPNSSPGLLADFAAVQDFPGETRDGEMTRSFSPVAVDQLAFGCHACLEPERR